MNDHSVINWLTDVEQYYPSISRPTSLPSRKRRRIEIDPSKPRIHLPTPSRSDRGDRFMSSSSKRQRTEEDHEDTIVLDSHTDGILHDTPRARHPVNLQDVHRPRIQHQQSVDSQSHASYSTRSIYSSVSVSNASSVTKQYRNAEVQPTGFDQGSFEFDEEQQPDSLRRLRRELEDIGMGQGIFPRHSKEQFRDSRAVPAFAFSENDNVDWRFPPRSFVQRIHRRAHECHFEHEGESSWNVDIHAPLLEWVFRSEESSELLDYRCCLSAEIIRKFKPQNAPSKMIDFCVIARPKPKSPEMTAITALAAERPGLSINHTDWGNLCKNPIMFSIETKRSGEQLDHAYVQIGTWHSSQMRSLHWGRRHSLQNIEFIAGVIIHGHDWMFVATIFHEGKAVLYSDIPIGSTKTEFGIYKLLVALQCLGRWAEEQYWPAFKADILGMNSVEIVTET